MFVHFTLESEGKKLLEHNVNLCKIFNKSGGFVLQAAKKYLTLIDEKLFKCPIKTGNYTLLAARESNFMNSMNMKEGLPSFLPLQGNFTVTTLTKTIIRKNSINLVRSIETFELHKD